LKITQINLYWNNTFLTNINKKNTFLTNMTIEKALSKFKSSPLDVRLLKHYSIADQGVTNSTISI